MSLKQTIKEFLKHSLFNESHPYFMMKMLDRRERKMLVQREAHSRMTYAQEVLMRQNFAWFAWEMQYREILRRL